MYHEKQDLNEKQSMHNYNALKSLCLTSFILQHSLSPLEQTFLKYLF